MIFTRGFYIKIVNSTSKFNKHLKSVKYIKSDIWCFNLFDFLNNLSVHLETIDNVFFSFKIIFQQFNDFLLFCLIKTIATSNIEFNFPTLFLAWDRERDIHSFTNIMNYAIIYNFRNIFINLNLHLDFHKVSIVDMKMFLYNNKRNRKP